MSVTTERPWIVQLTCCGRDNGTYAAATWEEADQFRESYASGPGAYAGAQRHGGGHFRSAIIVAGAAVAR